MAEQLHSEDAAPAPADEFTLLIVSRQRSIRALTGPLPTGGRRLTATLGRRVERSVGGVQVHAENIQRYFEHTGYAVEFVSPFDGLWVWPFLAAGLRKVLLFVRPALAERWRRAWHRRLVDASYRRVAARLPSGNAVVVYAQCVLTAGVVLGARTGRTGRTGRTTVIMASHSSGSEADEASLRGECVVGDAFYRRVSGLERGILPAVDGLVFPSEAAAAAAIGRVPAAATVQRLAVPNFLADDWGAAADRTPGVEGRDLLSIGRLNTEKNQRYLLEILAGAKRRGRAFTLTLVGEGPERSALKALATTLGVEGQVVFLGERRDVPRLLANHRTYIHASLMETFGIVILEAMAMGRPVIVGPVGGVPEIVRDGVEGRFLPLESVEAAVDVVISVLDVPEALARMGPAGLLRFRDNFSSSVVGPKVEQFFRSVSVPA